MSEIYQDMLAKKKGIIQAQKEGLPFDINELRGVHTLNSAELERILKSTNPKAKKSDKDIGVFVLGLVDSYVMEGNYEKALDLLDKYRGQAVEAANIHGGNYHGLLYVALLHGAIHNRLQGQVKQETGTKIASNGNVSEYFAQVRQIYLTPELQILMVGVKPD